ncbi:ABC transporter permease subunit [Paenibacillus peoriae]|uniref:ABC transporter permease n=1 Tax=Paenibacillus peoriae TaxID=59893 RepID=UPI00026C5B6D|nr:ABC transporter permease subunit [Paenibacillus peoriae]MEC0183186.1 ABC transporter permease subunit [Paenibacillus peoriae]
MARSETNLMPRFWVTLLMIYLLLPLVATGLYAFAGKWEDTLLPDTWTLEWFRQMFSDILYWEALWRSVYLCLTSVIITLAVILPAVFVITVYFPRLEVLLKSIAVLPYAVPGVVAAVGLIRTYSSGPFAISGTSFLLIGAYFVVALPYMYQGISNSLRTVSAVELLNAAELLGASTARAFWTVIVPNIWPGVLISTLLSFSILFGEFALTNMLVGGHIKTMQIYLYERMNESGHTASAIAISYFVFILIISGVFMKLGTMVRGGAEK